MSALISVLSVLLISLVVAITMLVSFTYYYKVLKNAYAFNILLHFRKRQVSLNIYPTKKETHYYDFPIKISF